MASRNICHAMNRYWPGMTAVTATLLLLSAAALRAYQEAVAICLSGALVCSLPWLATLRDVWSPKALGGKRWQLVAGSLLALSLVGGLGGLGFGALLLSSDGPKQLGTMVFTIIALTAGFWLCLAGLLIQFIQNRWRKGLSAAAVIVQYALGVLLIVLTSH